jgi:hypothetical protein
MEGIPQSKGAAAVAEEQQDCSALAAATGRVVAPQVEAAAAEEQ